MRGEGRQRKARGAAERCGERSEREKGTSRNGGRAALPRASYCRCSLSEVRREPPGIRSSGMQAALGGRRVRRWKRPPEENNVIHCWAPSFGFTFARRVQFVPGYGFGTRSFPCPAVGFEPPRCRAPLPCPTAAPRR